MQNTIIRVFDEFGTAEQARAALLEAGFARDSVELSAPAGDEAGAMQGNFTVGDHDGKSEKDSPEYRRNFANAKPEATPGMLVVTASSLAEADRAAAILAGLGARDPDPASGVRPA